MMFLLQNRGWHRGIEDDTAVVSKEECWAINWDSNHVKYISDFNDDVGGNSRCHEL
jgi:hypothetical protein